MPCNIYVHPPPSALIRGEAFKPPLIRGGLEGLDAKEYVFHVTRVSYEGVWDSRLEADSVPDKIEPVRLRACQKITWSKLRSDLSQVWS